MDSADRTMQPLLDKPREAHPRRVVLTAIVFSLVTVLAMPAAQARPHRRDANYRRAADYFVLLAGAATGLLVHEGGHLTLDIVFRADPHIVPVWLGPLPFFAISPQDVRNERELYGIVMMGFLAESLYTEAIFARHPDLVHHHRPFLEGMLAFHAVLDVSYAITGFMNVGPSQSDVNSMARAAGIPRWAVSTMLIAPIAFDILRYVRPDTRRWSMWVGMASRLPMFSTVVVF